MDITVVGNGVGGTSVVREAMRRGHRVKLIGGAAAASLAALAVVKRSYISEEPDADEAVKYALLAYEAAGCEVIQGANVTTKHRLKPRFESDWYGVDPTPYLLRPDIHSNQVQPGWKDPETDVTVHATGAAGLDGRKTFGVTWVNGDPRALTVDRFAVHRYAPYRSADAIAFKAGCRLGSSASSSLLGARTEGGRIFDVATQLGWIGVRSGWAQIVGVRVQRTPLAEQIRPGLWTFGGFHRSGWSLAPLRAKLLIEQLEGSTTKST